MVSLLLFQLTEDILLRFVLVLIWMNHTVILDFLLQAVHLKDGLLFNIPWIKCILAPTIGARESSKL